MYRNDLSKAQREHLQEMWEKRPPDWHNRNGAPKKLNIVKQYRAEFPYASKYACARDTGLAPNTVRKWWQLADPSDENRNG